MRICPPRPYENRFHPGILCKIFREAGAHAGVLDRGKGEVVVFRGGGDEGVNGGEGVRRGDVDCREKGWEERPSGKEGEVED